GRHPILGYPLALQVLEKVIALQVDAVERQPDAAGLREQYALAVGRELRIAAAGVNATHAVAIGVSKVQDGTLGPVGRGQVTAGRAHENHLLSIGRERRLDVVPRLVAEGAAATAANRRDTYRAQLFVVPGGVDHRSAVGRKARVELPVLVLFGQAAVAVLFEVVQPQITHGLIDGMAPVGAALGPARHADRETIGRDLDRA